MFSPSTDQKSKQFYSMLFWFYSEVLFLHVGEDIWFPLFFLSQRANCTVKQFYLLEKLFFFLCELFFIRLLFFLKRFFNKNILLMSLCFHLTISFCHRTMIIRIAFIWEQIHSESVILFHKFLKGGILNVNGF